MKKRFVTFALTALIAYTGLYTAPLVNATPTSGTQVEEDGTATPDCDYEPKQPKKE